MEYGLYISGEWLGGESQLPVRNKYSGEVIATIPIAGADQVKAAIAAAVNARETMAAMPAFRRAEILSRAVALIRDEAEDLARIIAAEGGKALKYARIEVDRAHSVFTIAAEEAKRLHGETLPLDAVPAGEGYFGFWYRRPIGVIAAISPFNFPLNLVAHKIAPALAAGNTVVLKPASSTPLTACKLCRILEKAGLPGGALNLVVGGGGTVGEWLITDPRVDKITFTGSPAIGRYILRVAGIKKVTLELGNASPVVIAADADLEVAAKRCAIGAYYNSGQVCVSVQRIYCQKEIYEAFLAKFIAASSAMVVGDPLDEQVDVGPMIDAQEVDRIDGWVREAVAAGARTVLGGRRDGSLYYPTILTDVPAEMKIIQEEAFGPVASVVCCEDFDQALQQAGDSQFALQAGVFTRDIGRAFTAVKRLNFGGVIINDIPSFRTDNMPYGGNRQSGLGREGVRFAMEDMTTIQMVAIRNI